MSHLNKAAWLTAAEVRPLEIKSAFYTSPKADEIVVRNRAVAVNPADCFKQAWGDLIFSWIQYPCVIGSDCAGEVVEVGRGVTRFKAGDRVLGHALGMEARRNTSAEGVFQLYTVLSAHMVTPIPSNLSYEKACVVPLGLSTAASGLFQKDQLGLQYPSIHPKTTGKTLLIWGGSTSVGSNAIQLATAAGYEVLTTASPRNFDYCKKLGASQVFDYHSETVVDDLIHAFEGKTAAGAFTIGNGGAEASIEVLSKSKGEKFISMATYPFLYPKPQRFATAQVTLNYMSWEVSHSIRCRLQGIRSKFIWATNIAFNEVGKAMYEDYLPEALAKGTFVASPEPLVVGRGLEHVQTAFDLLIHGVSAKKVVVSV